MKNKSSSKKEAQAQQTRRNMLVAATKLFARQGYHKTTITDICQSIGLTSGAIFHHFPSKEALLDAVIERLERGIRIYSDYLDGVEKGSLEVVTEMVSIMCRHFNRQPEATICLAALATEFAGSNHPVEQRLKDIYTGFVKSLSRILKDNPRIRNPRVTAMAFVGLVQGIAVQGLLREGEQTIDELARGFIEMLAEW
ncbi:TetR/AcrR family transcriptional regulator [Desulforhabdus amnigena]|jgi:AcrR family transcriptional regulator|nr:TetR/AcrR family transcriptional regulator [Desulforhabdus amnigena]NLJ29149.1 TetR/AcrR family transcriptional regulator [Deltaproteobacteria bacterium]